MIALGDVTVVLCTRDGCSKGYLDTAMRSVLDQSPPPSEVIVVDDASADGTPEHVRCTYPQVHVVANVRTGLAAARNTGVAAARGRWIAFMDDDDVWRPWKLAGQLAQIAGSDRPEWTIWATRTVPIDSDGRITSRPVRQDHLARWPACLLACPVAPSGVLMAKALLDRFGVFAEDLPGGSAYDYFNRCLAGGATVCFSEQVLLEYRRHGRQMTSRNRLLEFLLAIDEVLPRYLEQLPSPQADRVRTARLLTQYRTCLVRVGPRCAASYWRRTPLRRGPLSWRGGVYPLLDAAARALPLRVQARLLDLAALSVTGRASPR